jgi:hypothetical protein
MRALQVFHRADFGQLLETSAIASGRPRPSIWAGRIPPPVTPSEG